MSVGRFLRTPCALITPGVPLLDEFGQPVTDDMGDPLPLEDTEIETRCRIVHERTLEDRDGGVTSVETTRVYLPADLDPPPAATSRLRARGVTYAFEGPAHAVDSPRTGRTAYLQATLRAVS